jgi:hypothetical protein
MVNALSAERAGGLRRHGWLIEEIGFDDHWVPMYVHHDQPHDKGLGGVAFNVRVGNPKQVNNAEATQFQRKAVFGYFPWRPGEECMARTFEDVDYVDDKLYGRRAVRSEPYKGCRWCRARSTNGPTAAAPVPTDSDVPRAVESSAPKDGAPPAVTCPECGFEPPALSKKNKPISAPRRQNMLTWHMKKHSTRE